MFTALWILGSTFNSSHLLTFEDIEFLFEIFVSLGIEKIRLTGGEPMVRRDLELLVAKLARLKAKGLREIAMITNGGSFARKALLLRSSGLDRVTISLDSLKPANFVLTSGVRCAGTVEKRKIVKRDRRGYSFSGR